MPQSKPSWDAIGLAAGAVNPMACEESSGTPPEGVRDHRSPYRRFPDNTMAGSLLPAIAIPLRFLVVVALTASLVTGCDKLDADYGNEPIAAGIDSRDSDVAEHLETLLRSARTLPTSGAMRGRLGMAYDINGFREAALATYAQAESLDSKDFRWPYFSAQLLAEDGEYDRALESLARAIAIDADYPPAWLWRGSWLLKAGRAVEAGVAFDRAFDLDRSPVATFGRAQVRAAKGEYLDAIGILEPLTKTINHPHVYRTLGEALRAVGQIDAARTAMTRGSEAQPLTWPDDRRDQRIVHIRGHASYMLAKQLSASGQVNDALAILERLQRHHPEEHCGWDQEFFLACNLMNSSSIAHDRAGRPERAMATVQRGLALRPTFVPFHLTVANLLRQQRELESALTHVERAVELSPARGYAHEQRGRLLFGLKRYEDARSALQTALRYEPEKRTTLFYLGLAEVELGNWSDAVGRFERVIRVEPDFALGYVFLARSLAETGRVEEARHAQRTAGELGAGAAELRENENRLRELEAARQGEAAG